MPCSSTDEGAWNGSLASNSLDSEDQRAVVVSRRSTGTSRPRHRQGWEDCMVKPCARRMRCDISSVTAAGVDDNSLVSLHHETDVSEGAHGAVECTALAGAGSSASGHVVPPLGPVQMQLAKAAGAAAAAADSRAAQKQRNGEGGSSDGDSDRDFFTPLSSPQRDLPAPSLPLTAPLRGDASEQHSRLSPAEGEEGGSMLLGRNDHSQLKSTSTSCLPVAQECRLLLGRFPLRRRFMSADCGTSYAQQQQHTDAQRVAAVSTVAGLQLLAKTTVAGEATKERMAMERRISRSPLPSRRCLRRAFLHRQQPQQMHWLHCQQRQLQHQQQRLHREPSDEDIRMPLVPPPVSLSPLLVSTRGGPPALRSLQFPAAANPPAVSGAPGTEGEEALPPNSSATDDTPGRLQPDKRMSFTFITSQSQAEEQQSCQDGAQSHCREDEPLLRQRDEEDDQNEGLQGIKRRRFSLETCDATFTFPSVQTAAAVASPKANNRDTVGLQPQQQRHAQMNCVEAPACEEEVDFGSYRKRKRGGDCSARLLLMLQPNGAAAADAALLDVLGTALTAEETRELRMKQQKEAEAAAAAAAEAAAQAKAAAAAAAAAEAKAAEEAQAAAQRSQTEGEKAQPPSAVSGEAGDTRSSTVLRSPAPLTVAAALPVGSSAAISSPIFGSASLSQSARPAQQQLLQQPQQQQGQQQQVQQQQGQQQVQQQQGQQQPQQGSGVNGATAEEFTSMHGRPKLRIRRANAAPPATTPGISAVSDSTLRFQQQQISSVNPAFGQPMPQQLQMDVQRSLFQLPQQPKQPSQQPSQQPPQQQAVNGLGLGLAEFGPTVSEVPDAGNNPFAFVASRSRGRGGRRGGMRRR
ncbi:mediator of RNA polymerase II transcription subunit 12 [Cyclospora cayetanensis]|uniref:Mediator of RNA polymerase II transcription subunit 12 n=1 Tax=Cyclospora cayetanensis TaxID=88456 RepID=A0A6P6RZV6_9EIME|nr:mediator of RNA polymerase II transcription subunit 12 [Cyclospora cayetanensis]